LEASASLEIAKHTLLSCGLILAIGMLTALAAQKIKIPDVAVFLVVGMIIGPAALGLIDMKADSALNQIILLFGASYILFDGGASLRFKVLKTRETGVIPAALAGLLLGMKAPGAQMIASVTFIAILMTILIQAPTTEWLGRKLDCWSNAGRVDRGNRISVIPGRALRANPESRDRIPLLDSGSAPKRRIPERRISSPRPRRAAKRLRGLAEGADEGAAHPLRIAEAGRLRHLLDRLT
jgi:hypothetical protein